MRSLLKNKTIVYFPTKVGKYCFFVFVLMMIKTSNSQNLIIDGSFENPTNCPIYQDDITLISNYFPVSISPNIFNFCCDSVNIISATVPNNFFGSQYPRTGNGYVGQGFGIFYINMNDSAIIDSSFLLAEIIGISLTSNLISNISYCASFYVSLGNRRTNIAMDGISMLIISDSIPEFHWEPLLDSVLIQYPKMEHPQINNPSGNIIDDTTNWIKIGGEFIAQGGEKYLYIGSFKPLNETHWKFIKPSEEFRETTANYFVDDVSVYPCDAPVYFADAGKDTCISLGESVVLGSPSREEYLYWWSDGKRAISNNGRITVTPTQTTTYYLTQKDFKFDETRDSVTITVGNCNGSVDYSGYDFAIYPNPNIGDFQVRFNTAIPEGAVLELYDLLGRKIAKYILIGSDNIANISGVDVAPAIYYATVIVPNVFTKSVKMVIMR
ncbi:MAG: T9SS type A sorting domain-containing protein [Bacteroidales bacterium]|nr:T9SS type A sorting domain-containing protein [Bacteroidales bacterium]